VAGFHYRFGRNEVFFVSEDKIQRLLIVVNRLLTLKRRPTAREVAKFVGTVVSMERAMGYLARLMSRSAARLCASSPRWDAYVKLDDLTLHELRFWRDRARELNGYRIRWRTRDCDRECFSDASSSATPTVHT
jgi:hypothetical protein